MSIGPRATSDLFSMFTRTPHNTRMASRSLPHFIQQIAITQDAELAAYVNELKKDGQKWTAFVNDQQAALYSDIKKAKDDTFKKVYSDAEQYSDTLHSYLLQRKRAKELAAVQDAQEKDRARNAEAIIEDKNLATRTNEMNEWTVGNKQETLFVASALFITLSGLILLTGLWRMGQISSSVWVMLGLPMIVILLLIAVRRYFYTATLRNKRYWNKQIFEGTTAKIPIPSCDTLEDAISS